MDLKSTIASLSGGGDPMPFGVAGPAEPQVGPPQFVINALNGAARIASIPGNAYQSTTPITSDQLIKPAAELVGVTTFGTGAVPIEADALEAIRSGKMAGDPLHQLSDVADFTDKYKLLKPKEQQGHMSNTNQWFL